MNILKRKVMCSCVVGLSVTTMLTTAYALEKDVKATDSINVLARFEIDTNDINKFISEQKLFNALEIGYERDAHSDKSKKKKEEKKKEVVWENMKFTNKEISMIEKLVEAEATAGTVKDKSYIASTILNRVISDEFPDSVKGVILHKTQGRYQFTPIADKRYYEVEVTSDTKKAVKYVIENGDTSSGALYFMNPNDVKSSRLQKWFSNLEFLFKDGINHHYYK